MTDDREAAFAATADCYQKALAVIEGLKAQLRGEHCTCSDPVNDGDCPSCKVAKYPELVKELVGAWKQVFANIPNEPASPIVYHVGYTWSGLGNGSGNGRCSITRNDPIRGTEDLEGIEASILAGTKPLPKNAVVLVNNWQRFEEA